MDIGAGELLRVRNFGVLMGIADLRPQDYINYLTAVSARSKRVKYPQLHVVLSAKGREFDKDQVGDMAELWMKEMGYGDHPYMLIFHTDNSNNHVHIVSTRIGKDGKKVNDSFERIRAVEVLNRIIGVHEKPQAAQDVEKALAYQFATRAQFMLILEQQGYALQLDSQQYRISKFGKVLATLEVAQVDEKIKAFQKDKDRIHQLRQILSKYEQKHNPELRPVLESLPGGRTGKVIGYTSDLLEFLREKFGLVAIFHFKGDKPPYGYTLIDHAKKQVFKGGDIRALTTYTYKEVIETEAKEVAEPEAPHTNTRQKDTEDTGISTEAGQESPGATPIPLLDINIGDDIDDEAVLGRNRRRKKQARTNRR